MVARFPSPPAAAPPPPSQLRYPNRAAIRTAVATTPPALAVLPLLVEHLGPHTAALVFVALTLVPPLLTRIMASPSLDALLTVVLPLLAAEPKKKG